MFKELLESIIERTEGSLGALIMGTDGIAVEKVLGEAGMDANLDVAAGEFTSLVRSYRRILLEGVAPDWSGVAYFLAFAAVRFVTDQLQKSTYTGSHVAVLK